MQQPVEIAHSGVIIRGNLHLPDRRGSRPAPLVVLCHGFKGFKDWGFIPFLADSLAQAGLAALRFNFSHNGVEGDSDTFSRLDKFAVNTISREIEDLKAVLAYTAEGKLPDASQVDSSRVGLWGHSRGAASVLLVGSVDPRIKVLATWAGISTVERWPDEVVREWRQNRRILITNTRTHQEMPLDISVLEDLESHREEYNLLRAVSGLKIPYLVVHGDEDETVPFCEGTLLHDATPRGIRKLQIIPGAGHSFGASHPFTGPAEELDEAIHVTVDWFLTRV
jgi:dienelactone hydrolase